MNLRMFYIVFLVSIVSVVFANGIAFQPEQIDVKGTIDNIIIQDINNDSIPELIVQNKRQLLIYKSESGKGYALNNTITFPDNIFIYEISDGLFGTSPQAIPEHRSASRLEGLIGITPEGLVKADLANTAGFSEVLRIPTIFRGKPNDRPIRSKFIYPDLGVFIPCENSFSLAQFNNNQYKVMFGIPCSPKTSVNYNELSVFEPMSTQTSIPRLVITDINGDKKSDVLVLTATEIKCFINDEKWVDSSVIQVKNNDSNGINIIAPIIGDINNDGKADIVTTDSSNGVVNIYLSPDFRAPAQIIRTGNWIVTNSLMDLNNDGLQDMVLVQMKKLGVLGGLQAFLAHSVDWEMAVYLARPEVIGATPPLRKDKGFPVSPDYIREFNIPFTLNISGSGNISGSKAINFDFQTPYLWSFSGDYNKDGLKDLLVSTPDGKLQIYPGVAGRVFDQSPKYEITPASAKEGFNLVGMPLGEPIINDLNHDGISDIIIQLINPTSNVNRLEIFISK
ncbi:MAG: VCBS repeat-containing protein [Planctomycetota bacterium]